MNTEFTTAETEELRMWRELGKVLYKCHRMTAMPVAGGSALLIGFHGVDDAGQSSDLIKFAVSPENSNLSTPHLASGPDEKVVKVAYLEAIEKPYEVMREDGDYTAWSLHFDNVDHDKRPMADAVNAGYDAYLTAHLAPVDPQDPRDELLDWARRANAEYNPHNLNTAPMLNPPTMHELAAILGRFNEQQGKQANPQTAVSDFIKSLIANPDFKERFPNTCATAEQLMASYDNHSS